MIGFIACMFGIVAITIYRSFDASVKGNNGLQHCTKFIRSLSV